jgi:hypothetical protein
VEVPVYKCLAVSLDEFLTPVAHALGNSSGYPGWIVQFHVRVRNQIAVLFEVVGDADQFSMSFDHQAVKVRHVQAEVKVILRLKGLQLVMGFQYLFNSGLKESFHVSPGDDKRAMTTLKIGMILIYWISIK